MDKYSVFIRTDGDVEIGLGHLMRCLTIEDYLSAYNEISVKYLIKASSIDTFKKRIRSELIVIPESDDENEEALKVIKIIKGSGPSILITDSYLLPVRFYQIIRQSAPTIPVVAIDDNGEKAKFPVSGIINFGISTNNIVFPAELKKISAIGSKYFPIRKELLGAKKNAPRTPLNGKNVLVTMGGSDPEDQTVRIVKILQKLSLFQHVDLILGPEYGDHARLEKLIESDKRFNIQQNPDNLPQLMSKAECAITGGGMTCFELIFLGVPVGVLSLAEHQNKVAAAAEQYHCGVDLGYFNSITDSKLSHSISNFLTSSWLTDKSNCNQLVIDGQGGIRIAKYIKKFLYDYHNDNYSLNSVRREYKRSAKSDKQYTKVKWGSEAGMLNRIHLAINQIKWENISSWVDVGSGTAALLKEVEKKVHIEKFIGLELVKSLNQFALSQNFKTENANFYHQNFIDDVPEEPFDLVTCIGVLQKCGVSLRKSTARLAELTKPGGQLFVTTKNLDWCKFDQPDFTPYSGHHWFKIEDIQLAFSLAGLKILKLAGFEPREMGKICPAEESHSVFVLAKRQEKN